jgi:hypothetical protein
MSNNWLKSIMMLCLVVLSSFAWGQNDPQFLVVTRVHFNPKSGATFDQWKAHEKEYFDNVTQKNDLIVTSNVLVHFYTSDNSEVLFASTYRNWNDIEKAGVKDTELAKAFWPDEAKRKAYFEKSSSFYTTEHSDEIRTILPNTKPLMEATSQVYEITTRHRAFPADGKIGELTELMNELNQNVTLKNPLLKGYYPSRHAWGADSREYTEAFVYSSLADMEKSAAEFDKLVKAHWPDEAKRKEFFDKLNKYFEPWHGDAIYRHVPELRKAPVAAAK